MRTTESETHLERSRLARSLGAGLEFGGFKWIRVSRSLLWGSRGVGASQATPGRGMHHSSEAFSGGEMPKLAHLEQSVASELFFLALI